MKIKLTYYHRIKEIAYILSLILEVITCSPILNNNFASSQEIKDEKHYPNGTFVGKYAYVDNDGNPVQVKYYADDSSYGVELKSLKVLESSTNEPFLQSTKFDILGKDIEPLNVASDLLKIKYRILENDINPYETLNREIGKIKTYKGVKPNADYEIFYQKELRAPKKCSKDKVRVYFDKEKRSARTVNKKHDILPTCDNNM